MDRGFCELTAAILVDGFVDEPPTVLLLDNVCSHYQHIGRPEPSSILAYCS